jgi:molybdopterin molybdotransferase
VRVGEGEAVRISTGALLPDGADAVVRLEDVSEKGDGWVQVEVAVEPGRDIRQAGEDIAGGEVVLERGATLGPAELGVLASVGRGEVPCARRPRLAVLTTGDELVDPGRPLQPGQIRNTNAYAVPAQGHRAGAEVVDVVRLPDALPATLEAIRKALRADVVVVCGGVSVGPHDHVKSAFDQLGIEEVFWGLALRPGRPTWFGVSRDGEQEQDGGGREGAATLVFGLPGNPVSAMVTFHLLVRPALRAMLGASSPTRRATAVMDEPYAKHPGRAHAVRCRLEARADGWHVKPTKAQGSHVLTSMLGADALAMLDAQRGDVSAGERVEIEFLD